MDNTSIVFTLHSLFVSLPTFLPHISLEVCSQPESLYFQNICILTQLSSLRHLLSILKFLLYSIKASNIASLYSLSLQALQITPILINAFKRKYTPSFLISICYNMPNITLRTFFYFVLTFLEGEK